MLLIGRTPIVSSRFRSHQGLSPTVTPETTRAVNRGQRSGVLDRDGGAASRPPGPRSAAARAGSAERLVEEDRDLAGDAEVAQAVRPVARHLQVDREVAADVGGRFVVQARQGEPFGQGAPPACRAGRNR